MATNKKPIFVGTPRTWQVQISTANTALDGTGTLGALVTGATEGTRINKLEVKAAVTTTAGMIRFFIDDTVSVRLWQEVSVDALTPSATVQSFSGEIIPDEPFILQSGWILKVSTHNAEAFNVFAHGGTY